MHSNKWFIRSKKYRSFITYFYYSINWINWSIWSYSYQY